RDTAPTGASSTGTLPPSNANGILAGRVTDLSERPIGGVTIRPVAEGGPPEPGAPIVAATDKDGYFIIQGLQEHRHYQLVASSKDGSRILSGSTWATPPDAKVHIRVSYEFTTPNTPPPAPPPVWPNGGTSGQDEKKPPAPAPKWPAATLD